MEDSKPQLAPQTHYISNKEKHFLSAEKLQRRKFISGKLKDGEKFGSTSTHSIGRKTKLNEFAKKRGPKPKLRLFGSGRGNINVLVIILTNYYVFLENVNFIIKIYHLYITEKFY